MGVVGTFSANNNIKRILGEIAKVLRNVDDMSTIPLYCDYSMREMVWHNSCDFPIFLSL